MRRHKGRYLLVTSEADIYNLLADPTPPQTSSFPVKRFIYSTLLLDLGRSAALLLVIPSHQFVQQTSYEAFNYSYSSSQGKETAGALVY